MALGFQPAATAFVPASFFDRVFNGVRMVLRATKGHKDALGGSPRINGLERVFKGVPKALRATKGRENRGRERYAH